MQRTWLWGHDTERAALLLDFAPPGGPFDPAPADGDVVRGRARVLPGRDAAARDLLDEPGALKDAPGFFGVGGVGGRAGGGRGRRSPRTRGWTSFRSRWRARSPTWTWSAPRTARCRCGGLSARGGGCSRSRRAAGVRVRAVGRRGAASAGRGRRGADGGAVMNTSIEEVGSPPRGGEVTKVAVSEVRRTRRRRRRGNELSLCEGFVALELGRARRGGADRDGPAARRGRRAWGSRRRAGRAERRGPAARVGGGVDGRAAGRARGPGRRGRSSRPRPIRGRCARPRPAGGWTCCSRCASWSRSGSALAEAAGVRPPPELVPALLDYAEGRPERAGAPCAPRPGRSGAGSPPASRAGRTCSPVDEARWNDCGGPRRTCCGGAAPRTRTRRARCSRPRGPRRRGRTARRSWRSSRPGCPTPTSRCWRPRWPTAASPSATSPRRCCAAAAVGVRGAGRRRGAGAAAGGGRRDRGHAAGSARAPVGAAQRAARGRAALHLGPRDGLPARRRRPRPGRARRLGGGGAAPARRRVGAGAGTCSSCCRTPKPRPAPRPPRTRSAPRSRSSGRGGGSCRRRWSPRSSATARAARAGDDSFVGYRIDPTLDVEPLRELGGRDIGRLCDVAAIRAAMLSRVRMTELLRPHAEQLFAEELQALERADDRPRPPQLAAVAVGRHDLRARRRGGRRHDHAEVRRPPPARRARRRDARDRSRAAPARRPGHGQDVAVRAPRARRSPATRTLIVQGTAGTPEESLRYGWNYARLLAEGPIARRARARARCSARWATASSPASRSSRGSRPTCRTR